MTRRHQDRAASIRRWMAPVVDGIAFIVFFASVVSAALAQPVVPGLGGGGERLRILENEARRQLAATEYLKEPGRDYTAFNWGGWASVTYFDFRDDDSASTIPDAYEGLLRTDYRAWAHLVTKDDLGLYVRLRRLNHGYRTGAGVLEPDTSKFDAFDLDLGYLDIPIRRGSLRVGRQFLQIGRGLALSDNLDGVSARWQGAGWDLLGFLVRTSPMAENLDITVAPLGSGGAFRDFAGLQAGYTTRRGHRLYAYALVENDRTESRPPRTTPYRYDARYASLGWEGPIRKKLAGYAEYIHESGRTASQDVTTIGGLITNESIDSDALVAALTYFFGDRRASTLALEYAVGSGDPDRGGLANNLLVGSTVYNTVIGNRPFTRDQGFNYFGVWDLGLALSPRLSNLETIRLGYSLKPFLDRRGRPRDFQVGVKGTLYAKDVASGAVSVTTPTRANRRYETVGSAIDVFAAWRPLTDLSMVAMWGGFDPGSAFSPGFDSPTQRLLLNVTASF